MKSNLKTLPEVLSHHKYFCLFACICHTDTKCAGAELHNKLLSHFTDETVLHCALLTV